LLGLGAASACPLGELLDGNAGGGRRLWGVRLDGLSGGDGRRRCRGLLRRSRGSCRLFEELVLAEFSGHAGDAASWSGRLELDWLQLFFRGGADASADLAAGRGRAVGPGDLFFGLELGGALFGGGGSEQGEVTNADGDEEDGGCGGEAGKAGPASGRGEGGGLFGAGGFQEGGAFELGDDGVVEVGGWGAAREAADEVDGLLEFGEELPGLGRGGQELLERGGFGVAELTVEEGGDLLLEFFAIVGVHGSGTFQQRGELLAQARACAMQPRFHGTDGDLEDLGDLVVVEAFDVAEDDDGAVRFVELEEGLGYDLLGLGSRQVVGGAGGVAELASEVPGLVGGGQLIHGVEGQLDGAAELALMADGDVHGDAEQPGVEAAAVFKCADGGEGAEEGFLGEVASIVGMATEAEAHVKDPVLIFGYQLGEGRGVAVLGLAGQMGVVEADGRNSRQRLGLVHKLGQAFAAYGSRESRSDAYILRR
jgi:hypothetical protein